MFDLFDAFSRPHADSNSKARSEPILRIADRRRCSFVSHTKKRITTLLVNDRDCRLESAFDVEGFLQCRYFIPGRVSAELNDKLSTMRSGGCCPPRCSHQSSDQFPFVFHSILTKCHGPVAAFDGTGDLQDVVTKGIHVYLPYVAATQDEKMFRVVRDRERWFQIVMGEKYEVDEAATDRRAERVPLPESVAKALGMHLHHPAGL